MSDTGSGSANFNYNYVPESDEVRAEFERHTTWRDRATDWMDGVDQDEALKYVLIIAGACMVAQLLGRAFAWLWTQINTKEETK